MSTDDVSNTIEIYLTNGICEDVTYDTTAYQTLARHGLSFQTGEDQYPLSADEARYIADDEIAMIGNAVDGGSDEPVYHMLMGYSTLWEDAKFLAPCIEHGFDETDDEDALRSLREAEAFASAINEKVSEIGGLVFVRERGLEFAHQIEIRIPVEYAMRNASSYDEWVEHLREAVFVGAINDASVGFRL